MKKSKTMLLSLSALFASLVTVLTMLHLPLPSQSGYFHVGDSMIYIASCVLPFPYSCLACVIGGALADVLFGSFIWLPFTLIIKALNTLPFIICFKKSKEKDRFLFAGSAVSAAVSSVITVGGYFIASRIVYSSFAAAIAETPGNIIQSAASFIIFIAVSAALDAAGIKKRIGFKGDRNG